MRPSLKISSNYFWSKMFGFKWVLSWFSIKVMWSLKRGRGATLAVTSHVKTCTKPSVWVWSGDVISVDSFKLYYLNNYWADLHTIFRFLFCFLCSFKLNRIIFVILVALYNIQFFFFVFFCFVFFGCFFVTAWQASTCYNAYLAIYCVISDSNFD